MCARLWPLLTLALLAGVLQAVSIAAFWDGQPKWWLQLLSMAGFVALLDRADLDRLRSTLSEFDFNENRPDQAATGWRRSALIGWTFTVGWLAASYWWMTISMHRYGGIAAAAGVGRRDRAGDVAGVVLRGGLRNF